MKLIKTLSNYINIDNFCGTRNELNRENWLKNKLLSIPEGKRILDAGAGEGKYKQYCQHLDDVSPDFGESTKNGDPSFIYFTKNHNYLC